LYGSTDNFLDLEAEITRRRRATAQEMIIWAASVKRSRFVMSSGDQKEKPAGSKGDIYIIFQTELDLDPRRARHLGVLAPSKV
jgi:hypothetical protein